MADFKFPKKIEVEEKEIEGMKLNRQAIISFVLVFQKAMAEGVDAIKMFENLRFTDTPDGLVVLNPPDKILFENKEDKEEN